MGIPVKNRKQGTRAAPQWRTPDLTEVPLDQRQAMALRSILDLNDPDEDGEFLNWRERLPGRDILAALPATRVTLTPVDRPWKKLLEMTTGSDYAVVADSVAGKQKIHVKPSFWWQLAKADRRALQTVYFYDHLNVFMNQNIKRKPESEADWLRWIAVREAYREEKSVRKAYDAASGRLKDTAAEGQPSTMRRAYDRVRHILKDDQASFCPSSPAEPDGGRAVLDLIPRSEEGDGPMLHEENAALRTQIAGLKAQVEELVRRRNHSR
jgi:hypothetical protein